MKVERVASQNDEVDDDEIDNAENGEPGEADALLDQENEDTTADQDQREE